MALLAIAAFSLSSKDAKPGGLTSVPTSGAELNAWYAIPPGATNAADLYLQGFKLMKVMDANRRWPELPLLGGGAWPLPASPLSPNVRSALSQSISENREAIALFQRGNIHPHCRYPITLATDCAMPHLLDLGFACRLMLLAAVHAGDAGRTNEAGAFLIDAFKLAWSLREEPVAVSQAQRGRLWNDCFLAVVWMLNRGVMPAASESLDSLLRSQIANDGEGTFMHRVIVGERIFFNEFFLKLSVEKWAETFPRRGSQEEYTQSLFKLRTTSIESEKGFYAEASSQIEAAWREPYPERLKAIQVYRQKRATAKALGLVRCEEALDGVIPNFDSYLINEPVMIAQSRMILIAFALERYRSDRGGFPQFLSDLTPMYLATVPNDPFSGRLFRYRRQGGGYELYSVGRDFLRAIGEGKATRPDLEMVGVSLTFKGRN